MIRASVAMVTYNGGRYLEEQLDSVLAAMGEQDELVVSDDGSKDNTREIICNYMKKDGRVRMTEGPGRGVKQNVDHVLRQCRGKYIFLADQDDVWKQAKIELVLQTFVEKNCDVVVHDAVVVDAEGKNVLLDSFYSLKNSGPGTVKNIWRNTYMGCCMAFRRELLEAALPIPEDIEMHDQWIGVLNDVQGGKTCFIPDRLLYYRRHGENESSLTHYGFGRMLSNRLHFIRQLRRRIKALGKG
ncbi:MAG: glycosyltransferase [Roseburia sp.]